MHLETLSCNAQTRHGPLYAILKFSTRIDQPELILLTYSSYLLIGLFKASDLVPGVLCDAILCIGFDSRVDNNGLLELLAMQG